jgi:hypothetical protein
MIIDFTRILKELNKKDIDYIVVGGIAVNLHGIPRMTYDLGLLVKMEDENLQRLLKLFKELNYKPKSPVKIMDFAIEKKRKEWIKQKNMKAFCLKNDELTVKEIDIIIDTSVKYEEAKKNVIFSDLQGIKIPVISREDLIKMKKDSGRLQDEADIRYLRQQNDAEK